MQIDLKMWHHGLIAGIGFVCLIIGGSLAHSAVAAERACRLADDDKAMLGSDSLTDPKPQSVSEKRDRYIQILNCVGKKDPARLTNTLMLAESYEATEDYSDAVETYILASRLIGKCREENAKIHQTVSLKIVTILALLGDIGRSPVHFYRIRKCEKKNPNGGTLGPGYGELGDALKYASKYHSDDAVTSLKAALEIFLLESRSLQFEILHTRILLVRLLAETGQLEQAKTHLLPISLIYSEMNLNLPRRVNIKIPKFPSPMIDAFGPDDNLMSSSGVNTTGKFRYAKYSFTVLPDGSVANINLVEARPLAILKREIKRVSKSWLYAPKINGGQPISYDGKTLSFRLRKTD